MWSFKKKLTKQEASKPTFETILCVPGPWNSHEEFIHSIITATHGEYIAAGTAMAKMREGWHCRFELCEYDVRMETSFSIAGLVTGVTDDFLSEIGQHRSVVYLIGATGDIQGAERIARAGLAVLKAGGIGFKVETTGKAFMKQAWEDELENFQPFRLVSLFVLDCLIDKNNAIYSCGMQNLGYRDAIVLGEEIQDAVDLVSLFAYFQVVDRPDIKIGETFSAGKDAPVFRITEELEQPNKGDERLV